MIRQAIVIFVFLLAEGGHVSWAGIYSSRGRNSNAISSSNNNNTYNSNYNHKYEYMEDMSKGNVTTRLQEDVMPVFDVSSPTNITVVAGTSAHLRCTVTNIGNKSVSWIRHKDLHILTVGLYTYTSDERFYVTHRDGTHDWDLHIKWPRRNDTGMYECQVSTQPVSSHFVNLTVLERPLSRLIENPHRRRIPVGFASVVPVQPQDLYHAMYSDQVPTTEILGGPEIHVDRGSTINLTCIVRYSQNPPAHIFWYHQDQTISYDSYRGGISMTFEKGDITRSDLLVRDANAFDSGKYTCGPTNADKASVRVYVLTGEAPAAMQTAGADSVLSGSYLVFISLLILILCK